MYCSKCGAQMDDNSTFCGSCGAPVENPAPQQPNQASSVASDLPMNWFKFLIYFSLFAGALMSVISGFSLLTGSAYEGAAAFVYSVFGGLKTLDILVGLCSLASAGLAIYTRFRLAGFYQNGPKMLNLLYIFNAVINLIYVVGVYSILPSYVAGELNFTSFYISLVVSVIMVAANSTYFKKRAHMFVK